MDHTADQGRKTNHVGKVSIILAEPNLLLREKIAGVLARNERVWCVVQVSRKDDLVRAAAQIRPDFVLIDVKMLRDLSAADVLEWFDHAGRIFALVDTRSEPYQRLCERMGLSGLFEKSTVADCIAQEISRLERAGADR